MGHMVYWVDTVSVRGEYLLVITLFLRGASPIVDLFARERAFLGKADSEHLCSSSTQHQGRT